MSACTHPGEERLVELALAREGAAARARATVAACPSCGPRLAALERELGLLREALAAAPAASEVEALCARVLARTTREDPGWRGDWRLVRAFLGERWRSSMLLRVAAASLVLHLALLPVLAFYGLAREPRQGFRSGIELRAEVPFPAREAERVDEVELAAPLEPPGAEEVAPDAELARRNALQWDRFHLERALRALPELAAVPRHPATRVLAQRAALVRAETAAATGELPADGPLVRALRAELALDRLVLGRPAPELERVLAELGRATDPDELVLELAALGRAGRYGRLDADGRARLAAALERLGEGAAGERARVLAGAELRPGAPIDAVWTAALAAAAGDRWDDDPVGRVWLERGK